MNLHELASPFPLEAIHWRAQSLTRDGKKAMALAYIDARDVMDRLDEVCGPDRWQSEFTETANGRVICRLGILTDSGWTWKSDGAGNTDVEGDKGGISDALKRAAVSWGIGRYLYRLPAPWVPCETYEKNGKPVWKKWTDNPWNYVRNIPSPEAPKAQPEKVDSPMGEALSQSWEDAVLDSLPENPSPRVKAEAFADAICRDFAAKKGAKALANDWSRREKCILKFKEVYPDLHEKVVDAYEMKNNELTEDAAA